MGVRMIVSPIGPTKNDRLKVLLKLGPKRDEIEKYSIDPRRIRSIEVLDLESLPPGHEFPWRMWLLVDYDTSSSFDLYRRVETYADKLVSEGAVLKPRKNIVFAVETYDSFDNAVFTRYRLTPNRGLEELCWYKAEYDGSDYGLVLASTCPDQVVGEPMSWSIPEEEEEQERENNTSSAPATQESEKPVNDDGRAENTGEEGGKKSQEAKNQGTAPGKEKPPEKGQHSTQPQAKTRQAGQAKRVKAGPFYIPDWADGAVAAPQPDGTIMLYPVKRGRYGFYYKTTWKPLLRLDRVRRPFLVLRSGERVYEIHIQPRGDFINVYTRGGKTRTGAGKRGYNNPQPTAT